MFCGKCGTEIQQESKFCEACGSPVGAVQPAQAQQAPAPYAPPVAPAQPSAPLPHTAAPVQQRAAQPAPMAPPAAQNQPAPKAGGSGTAGKKTTRQFWLGGLSGALAACLLFVVLAATGVWGGFGTGAAGRVEGTGYGSPEAAVEAYITALSNQDVEALVSTFAIESYIDAYNYEAHLERMGSYSPWFKPALPPSTPMAAGIGVAQRRGQAAEYAMYQYFTLFCPEQVADGIPVPLTETGGAAYTVEEWIDLLANPQHSLALQNLQMNGFIELADIDGEYAERFFSEASQKNVETARNIYGADAMEHRLADIVVDGTRYLLVMEVGRYNGRWYNLHCGGTLGSYMGISAMEAGLIPADDLPI